MIVNLLSFASVYFFESGLFKGLQPIQTKKSGGVGEAKRRRVRPLFILVSMPDNPAGSLCREKTYSTKFGFSEEIVCGRIAKGPSYPRRPMAAVENKGFGASGYSKTEWRRS